MDRARQRRLAHHWLPGHRLPRDYRGRTRNPAGRGRGFAPSTPRPEHGTGTNSRSGRWHSNPVHGGCGQRRGDRHARGRSCGHPGRDPIRPLPADQLVRLLDPELPGHRALDRRHPTTAPPSRRSPCRRYPSSGRDRLNRRSPFRSERLGPHSIRRPGRRTATPSPTSSPAADLFLIGASNALGTVGVVTIGPATVQGGQLTASPFSIDLGDATLGDYVGPSNVTVANVGNQPEDAITDITFTGPGADDYYAETPRACSDTIAVQATCVVQIFFNPGALGNCDRRR